MRFGLNDFEAIRRGLLVALHFGDRKDGLDVLNGTSGQGVGKLEPIEIDRKR